MPPPPPLAGASRGGTAAVAATPGTALAGPTVVNGKRTLRRTPPTADEAGPQQPPPPPSSCLPAGGAAAAADGTVLNGSRKRARVVPPVPVWGAPPPPPPPRAPPVAATPAGKQLRSGAGPVPATPSVRRHSLTETDVVTFTCALCHSPRPRVRQGAGLNVVCATPGGTGRRMRVLVGRTAPPAPTPGAGGALAAPQRIPQAGESFFSANGSPLGAFVEDGLPSTPTGGVVPLDGDGADAAAAAAAGLELPGGLAAVGKHLEALPESTLTGLQSFISRILLMGRKQQGEAAV
jgi:hypothetical protein